MAQYDDEMDDSTEGGGDNPAKMKSCSGGQKCWNGKQGKAVGGKARFSLKARKRKKEEATEEPSANPPKETHQNARDLGGDSGDVSTYGQVKSTGNMDYDTSQKSKMAKLQVDRTATRKYFGK